MKGRLSVTVCKRECDDSAASPAPSNDKRHPSTEERMPFVFSQMKAATGSPAAGIAAFLPSEGADAAYVGTVYKTAVHSIKIDHGPMPANDALAFIIRTGTAQGRDIRTACHHLLHRNTRKFRLGQVASKHIRRRYVAKDGSCSGGRTDSGKDQSIRNARHREDAMPSGACAGR